MNTDRAPDIRRGVRKAFPPANLQLNWGSTVASAKGRYAYLDGIRGLAALFVIMRHTTDFWTFSVYRSYLAVDIFFILSGFVISNAYARKMADGTLSLGGFVLVRLIRLYPVYFLSLLLAIPIYLHSQAGQGAPLSMAETLQLVVMSLLFLPGVMIPNGLLFPINGPYWSLFYEVIANFLYGIFRPLLSSRVLTRLVSILGLLLLLMSWVHGSMDFGFVFTFQGVVAGLVRASFGIFFGILIHPRIARWNIQSRPLLAIALMCGVFMIPSLGRFDFIVDTLALWLLFPLCVVLAVTTKSDAFSKGMLFLGSASYPIYVLHEPVGQLVLLVTDGAAAALAPYSGWLLMILLVPLAKFLETGIDAPIRKRLSGMLRPYRKKEQSVGI